jgi:prophage maintenance system killer protein
VLRERLINAHRQRQVEQARWQALGGIVSHVEDRDEARALLDVVGRYTNSWRILREYDENRLPDRPTAPTTKKLKRLTLKQARAAIVSLKNDQVRRGDAGALFGIERDKSLEGILGNIEQTFDGHALYPSVEERAAALLYFVIKDHPFSDGNKRIGSLLFLHYLDKNACLTRPDGTRRFDDNALVAIALLVASSDPKQKDLVTRLILAMLS